jgi:hypothetical protein
VPHFINRFIGQAAQAQLALASLVSLAVVGAIPQSRAPKPELPPPGRGDTVLFERTIDRLRAGEPYYDAIGAEMRQRNYPTASVFNWRTPAHLMLVSSVSDRTARMTLQLLAIGTLAALPLALRRQSKVVVVLSLLTLAGALATAVKPHAIVAGEVWSGALVAASLCAYAGRVPVAGAIFGVCAVFMRELAAPYVLLCGIASMLARRRTESVVWIAGALSYAVYFGVHVSRVWAHQQAGDVAHLESWIRWNGLAFTTTTVRVNGWLTDAPHPLPVCYTLLGLAGLASLSVPRQVTWPLAAYVGLFSVVGQPFNFYWGWVTAPLWAFSVAHAPHGVVRLYRQARGHAVSVPPSGAVSRR